MCASILLFVQSASPYTLPSPDSLARYANDVVDAYSTYTEKPTNDELANVTRRVESRISAEEIGFQTFIDVGNGWNFYYSSYHAASLPIQPAAWALTKLYASMLVQAQSTWRKGPSQNIVPLVIGQIQLIMICPEQPIPWQIVENFASEMLRITGEGWTGLYQILLSHAAADVSIGIQLTIEPGT